MGKEEAKQRLWIALFGTVLLWIIGIFNILFGKEIQEASTNNVTTGKAELSTDRDQMTELYLLMMEEQVHDDVTIQYLDEAPMIRVLLKDSGFEGKNHNNVKVTSEGTFSISFSYKGQNTEIFYGVGEIVNLSEHKEWFGDGAVIIEGYGNGLTILSLDREYGNPTYEGRLIVQKERNKYIIVNELSLEAYLRYVVPSEMPSGYPKEALKAQAICARTYAYRFVQKPAYKEWGADVDDSVSYQVFNNIPPQRSTDEAIEETRGMLLSYEGRLAETYFYSTSCGFGTDISAWNGNVQKYPYLQSANHGERKYMGVMAVSEAMHSELPSSEDMKEESVFTEYITRTRKEDFEAKLPWYRWNYEVDNLDPDEIEKRLIEKYAGNPDVVLTMNKEGQFTKEAIEHIAQIKGIWVNGRRAGGAVCELCIQTEDATYMVKTENAIRYILCDGTSKVVNNEGKRVSFENLLPSAFFAISTSKKGENVVGYKITGGGYGHGIGMSQNGAGQMAKSGYSVSQILQHFFEGTQIMSAY